MLLKIKKRELGVYVLLDVNGSIELCEDEVVPEDSQEVTVQCYELESMQYAAGPCRHPVRSVMKPDGSEGDFLPQICVSEM